MAMVSMASSSQTVNVNFRWPGNQACNIKGRDLGGFEGINMDRCQVEDVLECVKTANFE